MKMTIRIRRCYDKRKKMKFKSLKKLTLKDFIIINEELADLLDKYLIETIPMIYKLYKKLKKIDEKTL